MILNADILENDIQGNVLDVLLKDRTTGKNIFWATHDYESLGVSYEYHSQILPELITNDNGHVVMPRVKKNRKLQQSRSKGMAEVFTPAWVCNAQNNLIDEAWFGVKNVFNVENENNTWTSKNINDILLPESKSWRNYVKLPRLEMACGEAPYLASRYDVTTGEIIDVNDRVGILDRKLKLVNKYTPDEPTKTNKIRWNRWALRALQSVYGFDWQGDNVLLAREALLFTYIEFYQMKWGDLPSDGFLMKPAEIISWNIWQMDGLRGTLPGENGRLITEIVPGDLTLFDDENHCKIMEWHSIEPLDGNVIRYIGLINKK